MGFSVAQLLMIIFVDDSSFTNGQALAVDGGENNSRSLAIDADVSFVYRS